jgi:glycosidase
MKWTLIFAAIIIFNGAAIAADIRVEPSCWWIGMSKPNVQLMVYGKEIGELSPVISYKGVKVTGVTRVENKNYLFIDIAIDNGSALPGKFPITFKKNNVVVNSYQYELLTRSKDSSTREGFNESDVIYLVTPDRFANGNASNDHVSIMKEGVNRSDENGRHGGDIEGIINKIDYILDMGFTSLWLTPALENNQLNYSYHGYSITDFYQVDPRMGSNSLYKQLGEEAGRKGLKLIMDMVFNHCGSEHWWMKDLPTHDWINFTDSAVYTNHRKTVLQDPHAAPADYRQMVDGWFTKTMPDLNQRNPLLATYLIQNTLWWIEYAGLSGIRVDTYPYPDMNFMSQWTKEIMQAYPNFNIVGEEWSENPAIVSYWQRGKINRNGYVSYLPSLMDFPVQAALIKALNENQKYNAGGFIGLYEMIGNDFQYPNPNSLVVFADNHDIKRFYSLVNEDIGLFKLGMAFILTTRGIPQVLYGTEILKTGESHGKIRSDFPGGWAGDTVNAFTGEGLSAKQVEAMEFMRKLLMWRKSTKTLPGSKLMHFVPHDEVYIYFRYNEAGKMMVVLNKNEAAKQISLSQYADMLGTAKVGKDILTGKDISLTGELSIPAKSPLIIEWKTK